MRVRRSAGLVGVGVLAGALVVLGGCAPQVPAQDPAPNLPPLPSRGVPARGADIDDARLGEALPPAPPDALPYDMRDPLRNGRTVPTKTRWLWIPEGTKIKLSRGADGRLAMALPAGTKLWKEFYLGTSAGERLLERRILLKVADGNAQNGWLLNGGWLFFAAHYLPPEADGTQGWAPTLRYGLESPQARSFFFEREDWLPTQLRSAATELTLDDGKGGSFPYVFPGQTNCLLCHSGAPAVYAQAATPVLAFGPHPENMTAESFRALAAKGWLDAAPELIAELSSDDAPLPAAEAGAPPPAVALALETRRLQHLLRNNCLSCHNPSERAAGRATGFVLDPNREYSAAELQAALAQPSRIMGSLAKAIVTPGQPATSELVMRLQGSHGRRRMPPVEGGVPELDEELLALTSSWIQKIGALAAAPATPAEAAPATPAEAAPAAPSAPPTPQP